VSGGPTMQASKKNASQKKKDATCSAVMTSPAAGTSAPAGI
jgi:hypothetical protein